MNISIGVDLVHIPSFAAQLEVPGSRFEQVFSALELRVAQGKAARRAEHLAGRWAAKEAFIKAWSQALYGQPPVLGTDAVDFSQLEVRPDAWGRVQIIPLGEVQAAVQASLGQHTAQLSISHDADYATATVLITHNG